MPYITYESKNFGDHKQALIDMADRICREYEAQGYNLTLRQLYYQFVSRDLIPNNQREYKKLGTAVAEGRMAGMIDWDHITDRGRNFEVRATWDSPDQLIDAARRQYRTDLWEHQPYHVEVWVEKDALADVIARTANRERVGYLACKGYMSASEMWVAGQRIGQKIADGKRVMILHLGDHDPSGIDMTRDIRDRLTTFAGPIVKRELYPDETLTIGDLHERHFEVMRIALNMDQIERYAPPPNPAKVTDSRARDYIERYGRESWELDALDPSVLDALITQEIDTLRDYDLWLEALDRESEHEEIFDEILATLRN